MMKTLLVILFAVSSSSAALAQHNVPGGGPVGSPGNPGTHNPGNGGYHPPQGNPGGGYGGGTHVPGGGPQGPNHGPIIVVQPGYPNYPSPSYPTPNYPNPNNYPVGPCTINSSYSGNQMFYTVYDGRGNYISSYYDFGQAMRTAQNYDQMGYCHGIRNNTGDTLPNPYPTPVPQTYCTVMPGQDAYGNQFFRVLDRAGRIIYTSQDYNQATQISRTDARCFQYN